MTEQEPWVVVWAVPKKPLDAPCWLMVKHIERGWELPGGKITQTCLLYTSPSPRDRG